ncbi:MAG: HD domain-containing protein [Treponema sp.]|nr:HD domain-containing protein [Treponema sp.]
MEKSTEKISNAINSLEKNVQERIRGVMEFADSNSAGIASILIDLGSDEDTIIAALILGWMRKGPLSENIAGQCGGCAIKLAQGVIALGSLKTLCQTSHEAQNIRNMIFALVDDIRVILITLAEKLYELCVMDSADDDKRKDLARECLDIWAPLADRLGLSLLKNEMEDLSLKFINRDAYQQIKSIVAEKRGERGRFLEIVRETVMTQAKAAGLSVEVESRAKHFYSVYMKMRKRGKNADEIFDLSGIRIICGSVENCYTLLGIIHRLWKPVNGCFKDYIARPKSNGYMSLHTSVMVDEAPGAEGRDSETAGEGKLLEIQIRTHEMHRIAENGIASHWLYKKGSSHDMVHIRDIGIINRLKEWKGNDKDHDSEIPDSWLEDIKKELFGNSVYVFTPQGKVIKLPAGATPIDFAYQIHSAVGEHCIGAKANGSIIPLSAELKNTQVIEILTSQSAHPNQNWVQLAKNQKTRSRIRAWLEKNDASHTGEKTQEIKKKALPEIRTAPPAPPVPDRETPVQKIYQASSSVLRVRIGDEKNLLIRYARCCNPVEGDDIIGYVSRGRGIIIHRKNCSNFAANPEVEKRTIGAEWDHPESDLIRRFKMEVRHSVDVFPEIDGAIRKHQGRLLEGRLEESRGGAHASDRRLSGIFTIQLARAEDLKPVMKNLRSIPGVINIREM